MAAPVNGLMDWSAAPGGVPVNTLMPAAQPVLQPGWDNPLTAMGPTQADAFDATSKVYGDWIERERQSGVASGLLDPVTGWPTKAGLEDAAHQMAQSVLMGSTAPGEGAAAISSTGGQMSNLKMTKWGPQNEYHSVPVEFRQIPTSGPGEPTPQPSFGVDPSGQAYYSGASYPDSAQIARAIESHLAPFGEDTYVRSVLNKADYEYLKSGTHQGSTNHNTGEPEGGLSVAHTAEVPSKYAYLVKGDRVGSGSDFEPLLDTSTAKPVSPLMKWSDLYAMQQKAAQDRVKQLGLSDDEYRALVSGHKQIILPQ